MAAAKDRRKYWLMLWLFVYKVCFPDSAQVVATSANEFEIVEKVSRRLTTDIYFINGTDTNCDDKNTYLISEDQCVKDQELFESIMMSDLIELLIYNYYPHSGCSETTIVPTSYLHPTTIAVFNSSSASTYLLISRVGNDEMFKINETDQLVNSPLCHISSLEVYRGRDQAIEISHQGFSLSENGSIKVYKK